jgi:tRNA(fMet)-specific endonuclease VapC
LRQQGRPIGDFDVLIAATALELDVEIVTENTTHFEAVAGLTTTRYRAATPK